MKVHGQFCRVSGSYTIEMPLICRPGTEDWCVLPQSALLRVLTIVVKITQNQQCTVESPTSTITAAAVLEPNDNNAVYVQKDHIHVLVQLTSDLPVQAAKFEEIKICKQDIGTGLCPGGPTPLYSSSWLLSNEGNGVNLVIHEDGVAGAADYEPWFELDLDPSIFTLAPTDPVEGRAWVIEGTLGSISYGDPKNSLLLTAKNLALHSPSQKSITVSAVVSVRRNAEGKLATAGADFLRPVLFNLVV